MPQEGEEDMNFDLHMHSGASSDGQFTPQELVEIAKEKEMGLIALSDHDTTKNVAEITRIAASQGIEVVPAIEVSTLYQDSYSVHLLGYGIDIDDEWLGSLADRAEEVMRRTFHIRVEKLCAKYNLSVDEEAIIKKAGDKNPWFTLMDEIFARPESAEIEDFKDYLPGGKSCSPAPVNFYWDKCMPGSDLYVRVEAPDLLEAIDRIHQAGGLAVLAHPFNTFDHKEDDLQVLINAGLDGIEAYSNYHSDEQVAWYREYAEKHGLLITCGSDFHGEKKPDIVMGEYHMDRDATPYLEAFKKALANR